MRRFAKGLWILAALLTVLRLPLVVSRRGRGEDPRD